MHPANRKKPCGARLFGQRKNANLCIKISVLLWRSGWDSNPRTRKGQQISSLPRYDRFDTTPYISSAVLSGKSERTTGENRLFNSSLSCPQSLAASGFSRSRVPRGIHDFECCTFDLSDNSPENSVYYTSRLKDCQGKNPPWRVGGFCEIASQQGCMGLPIRETRIVAQSAGAGGRTGAFA